CRAREPPREPLRTLGRRLRARQGSGAALRTRRIGVAVSRRASLAAQERGAEQRRLGAVAEEGLQAATRGARQVARKPGVTERQLRADDVDLVLLDPAARFLRLGAGATRAVRIRSRGLSVGGGVRTARVAVAAVAPARVRAVVPLVVSGGVAQTLAGPV